MSDDQECNHERALEFNEEIESHDFKPKPFVFCDQCGKKLENKTKRKETQ